MTVPAWLLMWSLGIAVFFTLKIALLSRRPPHSRFAGLQFLVGTPTLDPAPYGRPATSPLKTTEWWRGLVGLVAAAGALLIGVPLTRELSPWLAGFIAMGGICGGLHFGLFEFLVAVQRRLGYDVVPIMDRPWASTSLAEFWGRRWNRAFRDAAHLMLARPLLRRRWPTVAVTLAVFLASGIIHDVVMSAPAGGWGQPTAYFLIQFAGVVAQRTQLAKRFGLDRGLAGWIVSAIIILAPLPLLFHRAYCEQIMLPFYDWLVGFTPWNGHWSMTGLVLAGGLMQWSVLVASALVPVSLDWTAALRPLPSIVRQLFWTYGGYLVGMIVTLGTASVLYPGEVASGVGLGQAVAIVTAVFWGVRLLLGWFVFDAEPFLDATWKRLGYELLNVNFVLLVTIYLFAALR